MLLDLTNPETSQVRYKVSVFPDGQEDITILEIGPVDHVKINSRFDSFKSLELIIAATAALRRIGINTISLNIPYLLGARSDRQFVKGGTSYLVDVIAPILNAQNFHQVFVMDVHSDVAAACINNLVSNFQSELLNRAAVELPPNFTLVSPDGGALKKIFKVEDHFTSLGKKVTVLPCNKHRGPDGKLTKTVVPIYADVPNTFVIVDDICDGGRTFINLAEQIKRDYSAIDPTVMLIVTHGIFSNGYLDLFRAIDKIFCTNSYDGDRPSKNPYYELISINVY